MDALEANYQDNFMGARLQQNSDTAKALVLYGFTHTKLVINQHRKQPRTIIVL